MCVEHLRLAQYWVPILAVGLLYAIGNLDAITYLGQLDALRSLHDE